MTTQTLRLSTRPIRLRASVVRCGGLWSLFAFAALAGVLGGCSPATVQEPAVQPAAAPAPDPRKVWDLRDLDFSPQAIAQAAPQYPEAMRARRIDGDAVIGFIIGADGRVLDAYAIRATTAEFGAAAVAAVKSWQFKPPLRAGKPVRVRLEVPIHFSLNAAN